MITKELFVIVHNIRSAYNVGAIFRTADGAGVKKIYLTGYTPTPYLAEKEVYPTSAQKMIAKTALGAEKTVKWKKKKDINSVIQYLKKNKVEIIALEKTDRSVDVGDYKPVFPCALILGNEVRGISKNILEKSVTVISIPMRGKKESLNVSVAAGIAIYSILK